jgi:hypothetical protein
MPFPIEKQLEDKWCWAAVTVSVDHYFFPASTSSQCQIARDVLSIADCCSNPDGCNRAAKLQDALTDVSRLTEILPRPLRFDEIQREIDAKRPVCARIAWNEGSAHFVVVSGYRQSASGVQSVEVADPLFPSSTLEYDVFVSAYQNGEVPQGGGQWVATFLVHA